MKNNFGLLDNDFQEIKLVLKKYPQVKQAILFGSRAKGNYKTGSDIDIALKGNELDFKTINSISLELNEETKMPYKFDIIDFMSIKEPLLIEHIERVGIVIYENSSQTNPEIDLV